MRSKSTTQRKQIMNATFSASPTLVAAIAFGGDFNGTNFNGEFTPEVTEWTDATGYHGTPSADSTELLLGYVVYCDADDKPLSFVWELEEAAQEVGSRIEGGHSEEDEITIGTVALTREIFEEYAAKRRAEIAAELAEEAAA